MTDQAPPPRRPGTPLIDRPASTSTESPAQPPARPEQADAPPLVAPGRRHVWIAPVDAAAGAAPHPGLIHAWRHDETGWHARCTYVVDDGTPEGVTVTQWVAATVVKPA